MALVLAGITWWYASLVRRQLEEQRRGTRATFLDALLREFFAPEMVAAIRELRTWRQGHDRNITSEFVSGLIAPDRNNDPVRLDEGPRRHVSQFFTRLRVLCEANLIDRRLLAAALGPEPFNFYIMTVEPLDEAQRTAFGRPPDPRNREFFSKLLNETRW